VTERLKAGMQNSKIEFEVHETFAIGSLVANYRTDYITGKDGKRTAFRVGGVFYVRDGKISEWIDSVVNA
jgi:limonene-1,2-epoxide hydrolase